MGGLTSVKYTRGDVKDILHQTMITRMFLPKMHLMLAGLKD